jgi:membrane-bound metal-dependent hydrolase YbcI (DUF457 family)
MKTSEGAPPAGSIVAAMFLGHFAVGLAASRKEPGLRLGTALLASQLPDAVWPVLLLAGVERVSIVPGDTAFTPLRFDHYPWSHSLVAVSAWAVIFGAALFAQSRRRTAGALAAAAVVSHWVLDAASHRPDVPVGLHGPMVGLGLWNSVAATLVVEGALFAAAVAYYARGRARGPGAAFWSLIALLVVLYLANAFGPPPPSVTAVAVSVIVLIPILWLWGNRADASEVKARP